MDIKSMSSKDLYELFNKIYEEKERRDQVESAVSCVNQYLKQLDSFMVDNESIKLFAYHRARGAYPEEKVLLGTVLRSDLKGGILRIEVGSVNAPSFFDRSLTFVSNRILVKSQSY